MRVLPEPCGPEMTVEQFRTVDVGPYTWLQKYEYKDHLWQHELSGLGHYFRWITEISDSAEYNRLRFGDASYCLEKITGVPVNPNLKPVFIGRPAHDTD